MLSDQGGAHYVAVLFACAVGGDEHGVSVRAVENQACPTQKKRRTKVGAENSLCHGEGSIRGSAREEGAAAGSVS